MPYRSRAYRGGSLVFPRGAGWSGAGESDGGDSSGGADSSAAGASDGLAGVGGWVAHPLQGWGRDDLNWRMECVAARRVPIIVPPRLKAWATRPKALQRLWPR